MKWSEKEIQFLKENYGTKSLTEIGQELNRGKYSVFHKAKSVGLSTAPGRKKTVFCNNNYFSAPNLENCYWAGFIAADGYIHEPTSTIKIDLHEKDKSHLEKLAKDTKWTGTIRHYINSGSPQVRFLVKSKQWVTDLKKLNIAQNKSLILKPPPLTGDLALAFIRGYFDGDGSVGIYNKDCGYAIYKVNVDFNIAVAMGIVAYDFMRKHHVL